MADEMLLKIVAFCLVFNYAFGSTLVLHGNVTQINFDDRYKPLECKIDTNVFSQNNITYGYGLFADCTAFIFDATNETAWQRIREKLNADFKASYLCYGNDFLVDLQFDRDSGLPFLFIMDKTTLIFKRVRFDSTLEENKFFYTIDSKIDQDEKLLSHGWSRRGGEEFYKPKTYGQAGTVTGNAISLIRQSEADFRVIFGLRKNDLNVEFRCMLSTTKSNGPPPIFIDYIPSSDWRSQILDQKNPKKGEDKPKAPEQYLEELGYLWIGCLLVTILAMAVAIVTGYIINRSRKAQVKLEVAVEALLASSCTNPEHQLRRSALLNQCGFAFVELNDTNITTGASLQDETTGIQTVNEYDVLAEQIRRVQAAPTPDKSDKSGSNSTQSSKR
uniref:Uncharacterized protein n=1 Tax=Panagrolaimus sp. PS1159 TaxID=55785 RepID=A0AC35FYM8_9BILA